MIFLLTEWWFGLYNIDFFLHHESSLIKILINDATLHN